MNEFDFKVERVVNGWTVSTNVTGTPEDILQFIGNLDSLFGPVVSAPAAAAPAASGGGAPACPKHNAPMRPSKFGGFYCTAQDPDEEKGYCRVKVK